MITQKHPYLSPRIEVIEVETEGTACVVASLPILDNEPAFGSANRTRGYNVATESDLEEMINQLLTVEQ